MKVNLGNQGDNDVQLATVFEQSRQNASQISDLRKDFTSAIDALRSSIDQLGLRLNTATAPNFSTLAAWAGVIIAIIGMVASPIAYYFNHAIETLDMKLQNEYRLINETQKERDSSLRMSLVELDTRLQREFITANETIRSTATALANSGSEARILLSERVDRIQTWQTGQIKGDLEELRQRRMKTP